MDRSPRDADVALIRDFAASQSLQTPEIDAMASIETPDFDALRSVLLDIEQPAGKRTRAVFYLRTRGQKDDMQVLLQGASLQLRSHERG